MRKVPRRITVKMLERMGACDSGVKRFRNRFGESVAFVPGNIYRFYDEGYRGHLCWLLASLDADEDQRAWRAYTEGGEGGSFVGICAAALCRLARQNLPPRKPKAAGERVVSRGY